MNESRAHADPLRRCWIGWCGSLGLLAALAGCTGGSDNTAAEQAQSVGAMPTLTLSVPRPEQFTSRPALAWTSGDFTGSLFVRIELGLSFFPGPGWTLQHNGPAVVHELMAPFPTPDAPLRPARFEFKYADGYFVMTALDDNDIGRSFTAFGVDVYPSGVTPVTPSIRCDSGISPCYNGHGFFAWQDWPKRAGHSVSLVVPREDPAELVYSVLLKPSEREEFRTVAERITGQSAVIERGAAWKLDFPTARVKVRGCSADNRCVESAEQPLQVALVDGVSAVPLRQQTNAHVAVNADGAFFAVRNDFLGPPQSATNLFVYQRRENGLWSPGTTAASDVPGFGRTFALSGDGNTLAVEASLCAAGSTACETTTVIVFQLEFSQWIERARFEGAREPRLSHDGSRLAAIGLTNSRPDRLRAFVRGGQAWSEEAFPPTGYVPLDVELSGDGATLAAARQGTLANPCGCRVIAVYTFTAAGGWRQSAELRSHRQGVAGSDDDDGFGSGGPGSDSLAISANGAVIAVGASFDDSDATDAVGNPANRGAPQSGAIHVFALENGAWQRRAFLKARTAAAQDFFGRYVALSGDGRLVAGGARGLAANAPGVNRNHAADQPVVPLPDAQPLEGAAAYVFEQQASGAWTERASVVPRTSGRVRFNETFRLAMAADGSTLVLTADDRLPASDPFNPGGVALTTFVY